MEPEEAPNRAASMSSEMMSTVRDDPESYRELLDRLKKDRAAAKQNASGPVQATPEPQPPVAPPAAQPVAQPAAGYNYPPAAPGQAAQNYSPAPNHPAPRAKGGKPYLLLGIVVVVIILVVILLFAFKLI
jgi:hypothetical protein